MICWLASYPKSGNTWVRLFLANYFAGPLGINEMHKANMNMGDRKLLPHVPHLSLQALHRRVQCRRLIPDNWFVKTHMIKGDQFGIPLIPPECTAGHIYIVRDPRDVAASYAKHYSCSHEQAVSAMGDEQRCLIDHGIEIYLGSWSEHVRSWGGFYVRYEDMMDTPRDAFGSILEHLGHPLDERLDMAIENTALAKCKQQEDEEGFLEARGERFFGGSTPISEELREKVKADHGDVMAELGYN